MTAVSRYATGAATLRRLGAAALCAAVALLAGCAGFGPPHAPVPTTAPAALGLGERATAPVAARWWDALGDPQLGALVDRALAGSPTLAVARARLERASALAEASQAAGRPQGTLAADLTRQRYTENGLIPPPIAGTVRDNATVQANFSFTPDWFGGRAAEITASLDQARAAQADVAQASTGLAAQVARSYVALARLVALREVAERVLAQRGQAFDLTRQRTAAGLDSQVELTQAEGALPDARTQIEMLDEQIALAQRQLAVLSGQAPDALGDLLPALSALQLDPVPVMLGADLLGRRADLVAARWRVEAAAQDVQVAKVQFYPNVNLTAFVGLSALGLGNLVDLGSRQYGVSPALRLPIFDGGRLRAQLGARQAELDAAIGQYNSVLLDAVKEAGDAIASAQSIERQQQDQARASSSAETAYRYALQRFRAGLGGYLLVLNAETQVIAQRRLQVDLRARAFDTRVALMKALGGGWSDDTPALDLAAH